MTTATIGADKAKKIKEINSHILKLHKQLQTLCGEEESQQLKEKSKENELVYKKYKKQIDPLVKQYIKLSKPQTFKVNLYHGIYAEATDLTWFSSEKTPNIPKLCWWDGVIDIKCSDDKLKIFDFDCTEGFDWDNVKKAIENNEKTKQYLKEVSDCLEKISELEMRIKNETQIQIDIYDIFISDKLED